MHGLCEKLFILSLKNLIYSILGGCLASDKRGITDLQCRRLKENEGSGLLRDLCKAICGVRADVCTSRPDVFPLHLYEHLLYSGESYSDIYYAQS